jgi:hypothetical protein
VRGFEACMLVDTKLAEVATRMRTLWFGNGYARIDGLLREVKLLVATGL